MEAQGRTAWRKSLFKRLSTCRKADYAMMVMEVVVQLQASAALLLCPLDWNLRGSGASARNRGTILALIDRNLQAWVYLVFVTLSNLEVCQFADGGIIRIWKLLSEGNTSVVNVTSLIVILLTLS